MKFKVSKKLQVILCIVLSCTTLSGCIFTDSVRAMGKAMGQQYSDDKRESSEDDEELASSKEETKSSEEESSNASESTSQSQDKPTSNPNMDAETIMVYMVGSDLESEYGNATLDLEEMMAADADTEHNNIVVYTGGASKWHINGLSADTNTTLLLTKDNDFDILDSHSAKNMGDPDTLSDFINYCYDNFESEHYSLVLWNHGAGPVFGFGVDENYQDLLTAEEMKTAFEDSVGSRGERLEWIGFDACLMNSLEIADLFAKYSNYMIASQETEPGWGWDYTFLSETTDVPVSGEDMGKAIIDSYMEYSEEMFKTYPRAYCDLTLSCIDLNLYQKAEDALDTCFTELDADLTIENYPSLVRNREKTRDFGTYASTFDYGMVDAIHLLGKIASDEPTSVQAIRALEDMVVYERTNMYDANGISICYPDFYEGNEYTALCMETQEEIDFSSGYRGFLNKYYNLQTSEELTTNWDITEAETSVTTQEAEEEDVADTSDITLQLTKEQQKTYARGYFYILANVYDKNFNTHGYENPEDLYMFVHFGRSVEMDNNGVLHASYSNQALYMHDITNDTYSEIPMILSEQDSTEQETRYTSSVMLHSYGEGDSFDSWADWEMESASLQIVVDDENPNGVIRSAVPLDDSTNPNKQLLDLDDFDSMEVMARASYPTWDAEGNMMEFFEWEHSGCLYGFSQDLNNEYALEMRPIDDPENYVCMFAIKDVQGNITYSELIPLG